MARLRKERHHVFLKGINSGGGQQRVGRGADVVGDGLGRDGAAAARLVERRECIRPLFLRRGLGKGCATADAAAGKSGGHRRHNVLDAIGPACCWQQQHCLLSPPKQQTAALSADPFAAAFLPLSLLTIASFLFFPLSSQFAVFVAPESSRRSRSASYFSNEKAHRNRSRGR